MPQRIDVPGMGVVEFPDGMSDEQIVAAIKANGQPEQPTAKPWTARDLIAGPLRGAGSIGATLIAPFDMAKDALAGKGLSLESNRERRQDMDAALGTLGADPESNTYAVGKIGGELAGTLGAGGAVAKGISSALPSLAARFPALMDAVASSGMRAGGLSGANGMGARVAGGAAAGGAAAGVVNPEEADTGAVMGAALPPVVKGLGWAGQRVGSLVAGDKSRNALADKAIQQGIPLSVSDVATSGMVKGLRSALDDVPLIGAIGARQKEAVQRGFNRATGQTFGAADDKLSPPVMDAAKTRMGQEFDRIWNNNTLSYDAPLFQDLQTLRANADKLPLGESMRLTRWVDDIESKMVADAQGNLSMPGDVANRMQSAIRGEAEKATGFLKNDLTNLRRSMVEAFNRNVSPQDAQALAKTSGQYKAFKTVQPLIEKAEAGVSGRNVGDVPAGLLPEAVRQSYRGNIAGSPFADLTQIGSQFVTDRVPRTGGSARAMVQNSALGAGLTTGALMNPWALAGVPAAGLLELALSNPAAARALVSQGQGGGLLSQGLYRAAPLLASDQ